MKKFDRMEAFVAGLAPEAPASVHPCYAGYFVCFNRGDYYEAHDVLEHLWLRETGPDAAFYKGLIQFAGGYVHLRLHHLHPHHPKHGRRLAPAARLFDLAIANLAPFGPWRHGLEIPAVLRLAHFATHRLRESQFTENPWSPDHRPQLDLRLPAEG